MRRVAGQGARLGLRLRGRGRTPCLTKQIKEGELKPEEQRYFPAFLADALYNRRHLAAVSRQLGSLPGGAKLQFFGSRKGSLNGQTPLEALAAARLEMISRLAAAYAEL